MLNAQQQALRRLQDAYEAGALTLSELTERSERVRSRIRRGEEEFEHAQAALSQTAELKALASKLTTFAAQIRAGLDTLDWDQRQQLIRTLVARVEIDDNGATVVYRIPTPRQPGEPEPEPGGSGGGRDRIADRGIQQLHSGRLRPQRAAPAPGHPPARGAGRLWATGESATEEEDEAAP